MLNIIPIVAELAAECKLETTKLLNDYLRQCREWKEK